jgi:5-methyltetrahydropteroyltriglutamate--homocysteine methyltransferase
VNARFFTGWGEAAIHDLQLAGTDVITDGQVHRRCKLLCRNFLLLAEAGCRNIRLDEPLFTMSGEAEVAAAVAAINAAIEDLRDTVHVSMPVCQGNYSAGKEYHEQIGHRWFDGARHMADMFCVIERVAYLIECHMAHHFEDVLRDRKPSAVDVQDPGARSAELVACGIREPDWART